MIIDNVLPKVVFDRLKNTLFSDEMPWYCDTTAYPQFMISDYTKEELKKDYSFSHILLKDGQIRSDLYPFFELCCMLALEKAEIEYTEIFRIRAGLIMYTENEHIHGPHVDYQEPHKSGLLYINDNDGETIIYNEKYEYCKLNTYDYFVKKLNKQVTVKDKIIPKENRFYCFDGMYYHSSSTPTDVGRRIVVNFNFR